MSHPRRVWGADYLGQAWSRLCSNTWAYGNQNPRYSQRSTYSPMSPMFTRLHLILVADSTAAESPARVFTFPPSMVRRAAGTYAYQVLRVMRYEFIEQSGCLRARTFLGQTLDPRLIVYSRWSKGDHHSQSTVFANIVNRTCGTLKTCIFPYYYY